MIALILLIGMLAGLAILVIPDFRRRNRNCGKRNPLSRWPLDY